MPFLLKKQYQRYKPIRAKYKEELSLKKLSSKHLYRGLLLFVDKSFLTYLSLQF